MTTAIVTVNWNRWQLTRQCVENVRKSECQDYHLYIVDNDSSDGSAEMLADLGANVTLILHPENSGWAGGNNVGIARALADGRDFMFLLNNDAALAPDALGTLVSAHGELTSDRTQPAPVLGAIERRVGGNGFVHGTVDDETGIPGWRPSEFREEALSQPLIETSYVHGAALFAHRSAFERVGPFDERFFLYFDETDWCVRAASAGHRLLIVRDAVVDHEGGATLGGLGSPLQLYFMTRNRLLFAAKHCTPEQRQAVDARHDEEGKELADGDPALVDAFHQATQDFRAGRFGDCPPSVRALKLAETEQENAA